MRDTDKHIKEVWEFIVENRPDKIPSEEEIKSYMHFSTKFPAIQIKNIPRKYFYISGKVVSKLFVLLAVIILLASTITVYAVIQVLQKHINERNTDISMEMQDDDKEEIVTRYYPFYVPENYYEIEKEITKNTSIIEYSDGNHNIIHFRQELPTSQGSFDNEKTEENLVVINGVEAIYFEKHGEKTIIFSQFGYVFYIDTNPNITKEQLIKMAKSIKKET